VRDRARPRSLLVQHRPHARAALAAQRRRVAHVFFTATVEGDVSWLAMKAAIRPAALWRNTDCTNRR
jgi:hypothetical protein